MYHQQTLNAVLFHACKKGDTLAVERLLGQGADESQPNSDDENRTALHYASEHGHLGAVCALLKLLSQDGLNAKTKTGWTPIMFAANGGHLQVVQALFQAGADPTGLTQGGWSILHMASFGGYWKLVQWLVDQRRVRACLIDLQTAEGETPLLLACHRGKLKAVKPLIAAGADPTVVDNYRNSILLSSMYRRHLDVVRWLLKQPFAHELVNLADSIGVSPFLLAIRLRYERWTLGSERSVFVELAEALLELGADIHVKYPSWYSRDEVQRFYDLHIARVKQMMEVVLIPDLAGIVMGYATQKKLE